MTQCEVYGEPRLSVQLLDNIIIHAKQHGHLQIHALYVGFCLSKEDPHFSPRNLGQLRVPSITTYFIFGC